VNHARTSTSPLVLRLKHHLPAFRQPSWILRGQTLPQYSWRQRNLCRRPGHSLFFTDCRQRWRGAWRLSRRRELPVNFDSYLVVVPSLYYLMRKGVFSSLKCSVLARAERAAGGSELFQRVNRGKYHGTLQTLTDTSIELSHNGDSLSYFLAVRCCLRPIDCVYWRTSQRPGRSRCSWCRN